MINLRLLLYKKIPDFQLNERSIDLSEERERERERLREGKKGRERERERD